MSPKYPYTAVIPLEPDVQQEKSTDSDVESTSPAAAPSQWRSWRVAVVGGTIATAIVLLLNIVILVWASLRDKSSTKIAGDHGDGEENGSVYNIYQPDSCEDMKTASTYGHIGINIFSTLLLAASATAIQCLCAPSRADLDAAHPKLKWMHVGILSLRNWKAISQSRKALWLLLALTSLPLHLVYNSVIFTELITTDYDVLYVAKNFLDGDDWDFVATASKSSYSNTMRNKYYQVMNRDEMMNSPAAQKQHGDLINMLQSNQDQLVRLEKEECIKTYDKQVISDYRNVLAVVDHIEPNNTLLGMVFLEGSYRYHTQEWVCLALPPGYPGDCKKDVLSVASNWVVTLPRLPTPLPQPSEVMYCLAQKVHSDCTLSLSVTLMVIVIICNAVKLVCLILVCFTIEGQPLVTVGDAIASFLSEPDPATRSWGPVSYQQVQSYLSKKRRAPRGDVTIPVQPFDERRFWFRAAGRGRWLSTIILCIAAWLTAFILVTATPFDADSTTLAQRFRTYWAAGLNGVLPQTGQLIQITTNTGIIGCSLFANIPQLIISLLYVCYNGIFTSMLASSECMSYVSTRKPLRVSSPRGQQRSTYWLQLPYRYSLPLLASMAALHWIVSQSLFMVRLKQLDVDGEAAYKLVSGVAWSGKSAIISLIVGGVMIIALLVMGFRTYKGGMPVVSTCSLAISSVCHRQEETAEIIFKPLQYGIVNTDSEGTQKFGFSTSPVDGVYQRIVAS